jgi:HAD superfamily hydrolase (TIGR01509 family)
MIKAIIFDMDGLMVDTEPIQSEAFANTIRAHGGIPIPHANGLVHEIGVRGDRNFAAMKIKYGIDESIDVLRNQRRREYEKLLARGIDPMPGLLRLLALLKDNSMRIAIASNSPRKHIQLITDTLGIAHYFDVVTSGEEAHHGKPDPEIFEKTSQKLRLDPTECLVIEDAQSGVDGAKQIGMKVIAIPSTYTNHHNMENADKIFPSLEKVTWATIQELSE